MSLPKPSSTRSRRPSREPNSVEARPLRRSTPEIVTAQQQACSSDTGQLLNISEHRDFSPGTFRGARQLSEYLQVLDEHPPPARIAGFRQSRRQEVSMTQAQSVTPLRQRMLDDMKLRNMADATRRTYVRSVADFSAFHGRSPDELTLEDVRDYQLHLVARGLKASSICPIMSALRFLYAVTLDRPEQAARIPLPRKADPLPAILSRDEVARLPRGGRGRRARQVGHRAHPAALLRHPPPGARGRHPGDPGPPGAPADCLDDTLRPGRAEHHRPGPEPARAAEP